MRRKTHRHDLYDVNLYFLVLSCLRKCGKGIYTHGNLLKAVAGRGQRHAMAAAERCEALKASLHENRLRLRSCEQAARRNKLRLEHGGLSVTAVKRVLAVYMLSSWDLATAEEAARHLSTLPPADVNFPSKTLVRQLFLDIDLDDLLCMHDEANMAWARALKFARVFLGEQEVWRWVHAQNLANGVAPCAAEVFSRYESCTACKIPSGRPHKRTVNKWVARWRARWAVRRGRLRPIGQINPEALQQQACKLWMSGPIFGTAWESRIVVLNKWGKQFWGPKTVSILGPHLETILSVFGETSLQDFSDHGRSMSSGRAFPTSPRRSLARFFGASLTRLQ